MNPDWPSSALTALRNAATDSSAANSRFGDAIAYRQVINEPGCTSPVFMSVSWLNSTRGPKGIRAEILSGSLSRMAEIGISALPI